MHLKADLSKTKGSKNEKQTRLKPAVEIEKQKRNLIFKFKLFVDCGVFLTLISGAARGLNRFEKFYFGF